MLGLAFAVVFIVLNGFFVAAEFALVKVSATSLKAKARQGDARAARAQKVVQRLERYLSVTQLGITLASLGLGWIGEPAIEHLVVQGVEHLSGEEPGKALRVGAVAVAFTLLTFGHVLFGELVPKLVAIQRSEPTAMFSAGPLHVIFVVFKPLLWVLERVTKVVLRAMGLSDDAATEGTLSEDEILGILVANTTRTPGGKERARLVERVVKFSQRTARHAMVPRVDVFSLPLDTTGKDAEVALRTHQYSRILLTKGRALDEVVGYVYAKDLLLDPNRSRLENLAPLKRSLPFVPETTGLLDVLQDMQRQQVHMAVVVDEYGGTSGILTMEDLLEEIVGEIRDEFDDEPAHVQRVPGEERAWDVDAQVPLDELRHHGVTLDDSADAREPVGAVVLAKLGRIPRVGDVVELAAGTTAEITSVSRRRVVRVCVRAIRPPLDSVP